jgi:hypothetical protein
MKSFQSDSRGSITLVSATILLPILFFLLTISLDLTQLYSDRSTVQRLLDEAALQGYRYLPYTDQAKQAVNGYLKQLNSLPGAVETIIGSDSVEIIYDGVAPFTFASFVGKDSGIPYQISARARGTVFHAVLGLDTGESLAPQSGTELWGSEGLWPAARLFTHFQPFGAHITAREMTQQCFNPVFLGLKRSALRLFDYLSSFNKNSLGLIFFPGTLGSLDQIKDTRRSGLALTKPVTGYFNIANGPISKNSYCLALTEEEPLESPYRIPNRSGLDKETESGEPRFTDPFSYLVPETSLADLTVRETLWTRAIKPGNVSTRTILSSSIAMLSVAGQLNDFETRNSLAQKPTKASIILTSQLPHEGLEFFPSQSVKDALIVSLQQFWRLLGGGSDDHIQQVRKGILYYVVLAVPGASIDRQLIDELQEFFNQVLIDGGMDKQLSVRVVYSENADDLAAGVVRSLVLENNTAVIDG